nr:hypothetical protein [Brevibacterium daeguense]
MQKTLWSPDDRITAAVTLDDPGPLVVVEPGVLNLYQTPATLTVTGEGELSISQASKESIDAWVGETSHTVITGLADESTLAAEKVDGEPRAPNPAGGDLFEGQVSGEVEVTLDWDSEPARSTFLIASDGEAPAASTVRISWPNSAGTPWAVPLMIVGGVLIVLGGLLGFRDYRRGRQDRQRREARQARRRKLAETGAAFAIVPVVALAGCGGPDLPTAQPSDPPESAPPAVTESQLERIVGEISTTVAAADAETDAEALEARAAGPFLSQRQGAYEVKRADEDYTLPPAVAAESLQLNFASATDQWPRVTTAVTSDSEAGQTQLLVLSQEDPRAAYRLWDQTVLMPGAEIPEVPDARQGAPLLAPDQEGLLKTPQDTVKQYADVLQHGADSRFADSFTDDPFRQRTAEAQKRQRDALAEGNAEVEFAYSAEGNELVAQQTADGGAVVTGLINVTTTISPESVDGRTGKLSIPRPQSRVVDQSETSKKLVTRNQQVVSFTVPPGSEGQVALIGATDVITGAELE